MRTLIISRCKVAPELVGEPDFLIGTLSDPRIYQWGSLGKGSIPAKPEFPFLLVMEQPSTVNQVVRKTRPSSSVRNFQIMCYDQHGEGYLRIERVLAAVRDTLLGLDGVVSPSGARCTNVTWTGNSVDSRDPEYVANVKWSTYRFVTSTD